MLNNYELSLKAKQFLIETANHFNSNNRGVSEKGFCSYTNGCAIGIHMDKRIAIFADRKTTISEVINAGLMPRHLTQLRIEVLVKVQELHDINTYWDENGLSDQGLLRFNFIVNDIEQIYLGKPLQPPPAR